MKVLSSHSFSTEQKLYDSSLSFDWQDIILNVFGQTGPLFGDYLVKILSQNIVFFLTYIYIYIFHAIIAFKRRDGANVLYQCEKVLQGYRDFCADLQSGQTQRQHICHHHNTTPPSWRIKEYEVPNSEILISFTWRRKHCKKKREYNLPLLFWQV